MSQSSKVSLAVRNAILTFLSPGTKSTNSGLKNYVLLNTSKRTIQEATKKLTTEGALSTVREHGQTWYFIPGSTAITSVDVSPAGVTSIGTVGNPAPARQFVTA